MKRFGSILAILLMGCGSTPTVTVPNRIPSIQPLLPNDPMLQQFLAMVPTDSLSPLLGYPEISHAHRVHIGDRYYLSIPLEAEDEVRSLTALFNGSSITWIAILGAAQTSGFSPSRAETLSTYEGWVFVYDLQSGVRTISCYFEDGDLQDCSTLLLSDRHPLDFLNSEGTYRNLLTALDEPPEVLRPKVFLAREKQEILLALTEQCDALRNYRIAD